MNVKPEFSKRKRADNNRTERSRQDDESWKKKRMCCTSDKIYKSSLFSPWRTTILYRCDIMQHKFRDRGARELKRKASRYYNKPSRLGSGPSIWYIAFMHHTPNCNAACIHPVLLSINDYNLRCSVCHVCNPQRKHHRQTVLHRILNWESDESVESFVRDTVCVVEYQQRLEYLQYWIQVWKNDVLSFRFI